MEPLKRVVLSLCLIGMFAVMTVSLAGCPVGPVEEPVQEATTDAHVPEPRPEPRPKPESKIEKIPAPKKIANGVEVRVAHITDGDTLYLVTGVGGWAHRVRLLGVNAPECKKSKRGSFYSCSADDEYFGLKSYVLVKEYLKNVSTLTIVCKNSGDTCEKDDFDRYLVSLTLKDGKDLGSEIIRLGAAWAFTRYSDNQRKERCKAEADAIKNKRGMWKDGRPALKGKMSSTVKKWYYSSKRTQSHDYLCSKAMSTDFAKAAGE